VQADSAKVSKDVEIAATLEPIYRLFRAEVMEYLGVTTTSELYLMAEEAQYHRGKFFEYTDKNQYYRDAGKPYLARAAKLAVIGAVWPNAADDFLLRTMRVGVPALGVDFGCGAGRVTFELARQGHTLHFIDLDGVETYEFLKWRVAKHNILANFNEWPESNTADYVVAHDVFEHILDMEYQLDKICQCLKPGGVLITNYMLMHDWGNVEHINNDKPKFLKILKSKNMATVNSCVFQKMGAS
jgi:2-polyprenyl-3-methyl-5-hydroxy-6-metoxy-1,4-benzoquinol methylase